MSVPLKPYTWSKRPLPAAEPEFSQPKASSFSEMGKKILAVILFRWIKMLFWCREGITAHYVHIWATWTLCHPFETYFRVLQDGTQVLTFPFAPRFAKHPHAGAGRATAASRGLWPLFLCLVSIGLICRLLWVTFGPHRKIRIKTERNFLSHQVLSPAVEGNHIIWCLSNTYLVPSWNHLGFLPSLLLLRGCLSSRGYKPSSNFQPKYVQGSLCCV